ncbi:hypothetical protein N7540_001152 [Penicillium herquei]|nr:hypothetical protein N7540_001152 [Penicillium herquei]
MKYQTLTLLALNQNTGIACNWTSAANDCNLLRHNKDTRPVLSENPSNGPTESKNADSLLRRPTEKLISKAHLRHRPRPTGKHSSITSFTANPGFAQFLREYSSPKHHRVTAGGRIVPMQPVNRTMSAEDQESANGQEGPQNTNMQQTIQGYMDAPPSQQDWHSLFPLAHQIQNPQYQGSNLNPPNAHPSFNLYYSVDSPAHDPETGPQSNDNSFTISPANQAGLVFWNTPQTSPIPTPDAMAHLTATVMNEIEISMINIDQMRSLHFSLIQRRLNVQEALDQANIAIAWTQVTQPIQRDLRITYINMRNIFDEAIGILESRIQFIHTSTIQAYYEVGQPTGTDMSPPPGGIFVNSAANEQTLASWEDSSTSGVSMAHIECADAEPQANTANEMQFDSQYDDQTAFTGSLHRQWRYSSGASVTHIEYAEVEPQANTANEVQFNSQSEDETAFMGSLHQRWGHSSGISVTHIESADVELQANTSNEMQFESLYDDHMALMGSPRRQWSHRSGISVTHVENADTELQANTANEVHFNSQHDDDTASMGSVRRQWRYSSGASVTHVEYTGVESADTVDEVHFEAFMGSSRLEWSPERNLQVDVRDPDSDNDYELHDHQFNQFDGTCSEEGVRHASDDELSPRRSSGFGLNRAPNDGPLLQFSSSWPSNFLETDNDALLSGGCDIEPELEGTRQNWEKNSRPGSSYEGLLDSDQHENHDGNETESESDGVDPKQNPHPLSRHHDSDKNNSLTSDEWTIFLSPPRCPQPLISHPTATSEVNEIDTIMSGNDTILRGPDATMPDNDTVMSGTDAILPGNGTILSGSSPVLSEPNIMMAHNHNENNAANPEGGQADRHETGNQATAVRQHGPFHLVNGEAEEQLMEQAAAALPNNLMAANHIGEGDSNNSNRRGNATVQLSTAGALGELTQGARDNGAQITSAVLSLQQVLATGEATLARRRRLGRPLAGLPDGLPAGHHQPGELQAAPLTAADLARAAAELRGQNPDPDENEDEDEED